MVYKTTPSFNLKTKEHSANDFTKFLGTTYFHTNNSAQDLESRKFTLALFWQKFRESNNLTKEIAK